MKIFKPDFYEKFKCKASECTDSCCIGWEIDVDDVTYKKYSFQKSEFFKKVNDKISVSSDSSRCFLLDENERCPFLNESNLCEIIINSSEEFLSDICKEHPRFYNEFLCATEMGLGLCCEKTVSLLLECERFKVIEEEFENANSEKFSDEEISEIDFYNELKNLRDRIFGVLSSDISFFEKIEAIKIESEKYSGEIIDVLNFAEIIDLYEKTEPINEKWVMFLNEMKKEIKNAFKCESEFKKETEHNKFYSIILAYIIYRHLSNAVYDGEVSKRIAFCIESVMFIALCDLKSFYENKKITVFDRINNIKRWSQQIEYSQENLDLAIYKDILA